MSLLTSQMSDFTIIDKRTVSDDMGGYSTEWTDGATIKAVAVKDSSLQARVAEKQGVVGMYTITTERPNMLQYHDVIRREEDGTIFRVLSNGKDKKTPSTAGLNMRQVLAEEWTLTDEQI
jgi:hypothetical protein